LNAAGAIALKDLAVGSDTQLRLRWPKLLFKAEFFGGGLDIRRFSERMFDAAEVPAAIRAEYNRPFEKFVKTLKQVKRRITNVAP